jgi:hypothetical protein
MSPSGKPVRSRYGSRESKKLVEGEEGLLGKEDLTPRTSGQKTQSSRRRRRRSLSVRKMRGVIIEWLCNLVSPPEAYLPFPAWVALPE